MQEGRKKSLHSDKKECCQLLFLLLKVNSRSDAVSNSKASLFMLTDIGENQCVCVYVFAGGCVCVVPYEFGGKSGAGGGVSVCWGGYSLVMLTAFYKLRLTLLPTAD